MRIKIKNNFALSAYYEKPFGGGMWKPHHGPQAWPWWRLFVLTPYSTNPAPPSSSWNVWLYTRWGALMWHVAIDRRTQKQIGL